MSPCPHLDVVLGGAIVPCLIDTGSMVSTITQSCFIQHFGQWGQEHLQACHWLQLQAANGLAIPYIGYLELEVELCGKLMPQCGVLVVRDPPGESSPRVPGVLGMNVIRRCYQELFGQHGLGLFESPAVSAAPELVMQVLQQCHCSRVQSSSGTPGKVRVRGRKVCRVPGGTMKLVAATCSRQYASATVLFEPTFSGLPGGLLACPALVQVIGGTSYVPVINVGSTDVVLYPHTIMGTLDGVYVVSLPAGVVEVPSATADVASLSVASAMLDQVDSLDLSSLSVDQQAQVRSLLRRYISVFFSSGWGGRLYQLACP